jgi:hypothetical protein
MFSSARVRAGDHFSGKERAYRARLTSKPWHRAIRRDELSDPLSQPPFQREIVRWNLQHPTDRVFFLQYFLAQIVLLKSIHDRVEVMRQSFQREPVLAAIERQKPGQVP